MRKHWSLKRQLWALALLFPSLLFAQTTRGRLNGTVTDATGASVPGAQVTVVKTDTGTKYQTETSEAGIYAVPELPYGTYTVTITKEGFKTLESRQIVISANQNTRFDATLELGEIAQTIDVTASVPVIQTDSATVQANFTTRQILDLPLAIGAVGNSRSPETFTFLTPGVSGNTFLTRVNGGQRFSNEVLIDGASTYRSENGPAFDETAPSVEALGEFTIKTNNFSAEYGATGSSITSFAYKSGSNELHGSVYDFLRATPFNAAGFYNTGRCTINGQKVTDGRCNDASLNPKRRPALDQKNDYGFTVGGPVYFPKLYNGKDRTFWFMSFERYDQANQFPANPVRYPTERMQSGDFGELLALPNPIVIHDPVTGQPFPNNVIPQNRFSSVSRYALQFLPKPQIVNPSNGLRELYTNGVPLTQQTNLYTWTGDHNLTVKQKLHGSFSYRDNFRTRDPNNLLPLDNPLTQGREQKFTTKYFRVSHDYFLSPSVLNHLIIGWNRTFSRNGTVTFDDNFVQGAGLRGVANTHTPTQNINDYVTLGNQELNRNIDTNYQIGNDLSWIKGSHTLKFGAFFVRQLYNPKTQNNGAGTWNFNSAATSSLTGAGGDGFASYLLGAVQSGFFNFNLVNPGWRRLYSAFYAQDDFKVTPKLTLNYGVRWEISDPRVEVANRTSSLDPSLPNPGAAGILGALAFANEDRRRFDDQYWGGVGPRLGINYAINDKTVIHTGFGIYYSKVFYGDFGENTKQGFDASPNFNTPDGRRPAFFWQDGVPQPSQRPPIFDPAYVNRQTIDYIAKDGSKPVQTYNWTFGIERELARNLAINVSYVGNGAQNLNRGFNLNQLDPQHLRLGDLLSRNINDPAVVAAGFRAPYPTFAADWGGGATLARALRSFPQYENINFINNTDGHSTYHSLQVKVEKKFSDGLQFLVAYTASKTLTNADSRLTWLSEGAQNDRLGRLSKSVGNDDQPQVFAASFIYELPAGRGKKFLNRPGVVDKIAGGWQISGIMQYQSGTPMPVFAGCPDIERVNAGGCRANIISSNVYGPGASGKPDPNNGQPYINPAAFVAPAPFQFGNTERTNSYLRGFGYLNENFALFKSAKLKGESLGLQFRMEMFNVFNRVIFNNPDLFVGAYDPAFPQSIRRNQNFGFFQGQRNTPRFIQFGLKILF